MRLRPIQASRPKLLPCSLPQNSCLTVLKSAANTHMQMPAVERMPGERRCHDMLLSWADSEVMVLVCLTETASACEHVTSMAGVPCMGRTSNAVCSPKALSNSSRLISLPEEMSVTSPEPADDPESVQAAE